MILLTMMVVAAFLGGWQANDQSSTEPTVQPDGKTTIAVRSPRGWAPSGGMCDSEGSLWLLEYSVNLFGPSETRVRRIDRAENARAN